MSDFIAALGLVLVLEGLAYAAFPGAMRRAVEIMATSPDGQLRIAGIASAIVGIAIVWFVRG
jgi:uncharacterized protein YjeT (DUF2065 family)